MRLEVEREFTLAFPGAVSDAVAFLRDVRRSLMHVPFIQNLRVEGADVFADLRIDVPIIGEQFLDFHSRLEPTADGANLIALPREGKAWAEVAGQGQVTAQGTGSSIAYHLRITAHITLPVGERWGGKAFEKMAMATAQHAIERMTLEFPAGVTAGMSG